MKWGASRYEEKKQAVRGAKGGGIVNVLNPEAGAQAATSVGGRQSITLRITQNRGHGLRPFRNDSNKCMSEIHYVVDPVHVMASSFR